MSKLFVKTDRVVRLSRSKGQTVSLINNDANNDVYYDTDPAILLGANTLAGGVPAGSKIAKAGGLVQIANWSSDYFFRSAPNDAVLDVQP